MFEGSSTVFERSHRKVVRSVIATLSAGVLVVGTVGCSAGSADSSVSVSASSSSSSAGQTEASEASTTNTELSAGSVTVSVGNKQVTYNAAYLVDGIDATIDGGTYQVAEADEVVFLVVNGGSLTITNASINKSGDAASSDSERTSDVSDEYNFYGANSAIVVVGDGSSATVDGTTITTTSSGSNAVVAVDGAEAVVTSTTIDTSGNSSRGLHATYAGTITASDMTITTQGSHSAAVATDRGGGTVSVTGTNVFNTNGDGSPLVYSTGDISVDGLSGTAGQSQVVVVEGKNSATISDADVTASGNDAVMIYQSMSGDAADSDAVNNVGAVTITDSTISYTGSGPVFYFTNTTGELELTNVVVDSSSGALALATEDRWGTEGSNGAAVTWTVTGSNLTGTIEAGDSSSIAIIRGSDASIEGDTSGSVTIG